MAFPMPRAVPSFDNIGGIAIPSWAGAVLAAAAAVSAITVLLVVLRNRRK
ncbi:hypothetical protein [Amycolatopsis benzoatilytica]|nr:hypothetical protein [Amycolatopsis benzoatilytica]